METILKALGFSLICGGLIAAMHCGTYMMVKVNSHPPESFRIACSVRQDSPLSPLLYLLVLKPLPWKLEQLRGIAFQLGYEGQVLNNAIGMASDDSKGI